MAILGNLLVTGVAKFTNTIKGTITNALDSVAVKTFGSRQTTGNTLYGDGKLRFFQATSSMTEGKPIFDGTAQDANVISMAWDNTGGWDTQIAQNNLTGKLAARGMHDGTWTDWHTIIDSSGGTITGTLILSNSNDAARDSNNSPALIVGGTPTGVHLEFDGNEIMAKSNASTASPLFIQNEGGLISTGSGGIGTDGSMYAKGSVRVGATSKDTNSGGCNMTYNASTKTMEFEVS